MGIENNGNKPIFDSLLIRQALGVPSENEASLMMKLLRPVLVTACTRSLSNKGLCLKGLSKSKNLHEKNGEKISIVRDCAAVVQETIGANSRKFASESILSSPEGMRFLYDFLTGARSLLEPIFLTVDDRAESAISESLSEFSKRLNLSTEDDVNNYLYVKRERVQAILSLSDDHDPTGFSLVDKLVEETKSESHNPVMSREYLVAGAELARDLYKIVYKTAISGNLYSEQKPKQVPWYNIYRRIKK